MPRKTPPPPDALLASKMFREWIKTTGLSIAQMSYIAGENHNHFMNVCYGRVNQPYLDMQSCFDAYEKHTRVMVAASQWISQKFANQEAP